MTIDDLISRLSSYPGYLDVKVVVLTREGMFNDAATANGDHVQLCEANDAVGITGSETDDAARPGWVVTGCHCGIEHDADTTGASCELPARQSPR